LNGLISIRKNGSGFFEKSIPTVLWEKNEKFANFYPDLGLGSKVIIRGPAANQKNNFDGIEN